MKTGKLSLFLFCIFIMPFLLIRCLTSCTTTKYIDKEKIILDSSVVQENQALHTELKQTIEYYESQRESWEKTGIVFDTLRINDTFIVNRVIFDNGKIKTVEGRIRSISTDLYNKNTDLQSALTTIDSMSIELDRKDAKLNKQVTTITKEVKRKVHVWWIYIILFLAGLILEYRFKIIKRIISIKSIL